MRRVVFLLLFLFLSVHASAADEVRACLLRLQELQMQHPGSLKGIYPSEIRSGTWFYRDRPDENIFFNSLIDYTLRASMSGMKPPERMLADSLLARSAPVYPYFRNRSGRLSYNFWRTDTMPPFPYGRALTAGHSDPKLPDDLDDTVLSLWSLEVGRDTAMQAHRLMQGFTAGAQKPVRTAIAPLRRFEAYSTWYGQRFPVVFDICVLANVLSFVQHYRLPWTAADSASMQVIGYALRSGLAMEAPHYCAPYYPEGAVILYHLGRLRQYGRIAELERMVPELREWALHRLGRTDDVLEQLLLRTALLRFGIEKDTLPPMHGVDRERLEGSRLAFFVGNIPSSFLPGIQQLFIENGWLQYGHYCPAFNEAIYLEYLLMTRD